MRTRLDEIVSLVDEGKVVADIGADHGITSMAVHDLKKPKKIIATDISRPSLEKLIKKLEVNPSYTIETRVTDGLKGLEKDGLENIIISGMGGYLIAKIIEASWETAHQAEKLILQANNSNHYLRKKLHQLKFKISDEKIVFEDGIYYNIILASPIKSKEVEKYYRDIEYEYGKVLLDRQDSLLESFLKKEIEEINFIYKEIESLTGEKIETRKEELKKKKSKIEEILSCW